MKGLFSETCKDVDGDYIQAMNLSSLERWIWVCQPLLDKTCNLFCVPNLPLNNGYKAPGRGGVGAVAQQRQHTGSTILPSAILHPLQG